MSRVNWLVALALVTAGCGITPSAAMERAAPPVVTLPTPSKRIWLVRNGSLVPWPANTESNAVESLIEVLFRAADEPLPEEMTTALRGFSLDNVHTSQDPIYRDESMPPRTVTLTIFLTGEGKLTRLAKAQIVCTAQEDTTVATVKIVRLIEGQSDKAEKSRDCAKLK